MNVRNSYLIEVRAGVRGYGFHNFHIFNGVLTNSINLGQVGALWPPAANSCVNQAMSPSRVETRGIRINACNLSASNESYGVRLSGSRFAVPGIAREALTSTRTHAS